MAAGDGLISMAPTSIAYSGTSAGINADGGVDFSAVTSLSLNGVFTSAYDNYLIVFTNIAASGDPTIEMRLRAAGSDASGSNYTYESFQVNNTTIDAARGTSTTSGRGGLGSATTRSGFHIHVYGSYLAQPTAWRVVSAWGVRSGEINEYANTHSLSTSYDGFTLSPQSSSITGNIAVFGYEE
jgi:hypothetical protein